MDPKPDVIRRQIDETRESLTDKLETLEDQVKHTVASVTEAVEHTVDTVKSKVENTVEAVTSTARETVDTVKRSFDIPYQVQRHPYLLTGGAVLAGAALGYLVGRRRAEYRPRRASARFEPSAAYQPERAFHTPESAFHPGGDGFSAARQESRPGIFSSLLEPLAGEFDKIKATAIGALLGMVRDAVKRAVPPSLHDRVEQIMNDITRRAGGEPVHGPVLPAGGSPGAPAPGPSETHL
jgi:hypothetical protein